MTVKNSEELVAVIPEFVNEDRNPVSVLTNSSGMGVSPLILKKVF